MHLCTLAIVICVHTYNTAQFWWAFIEWNTHEFDSLHLLVMFYYTGIQTFHTAKIYIFAIIQSTLYMYQI